MTTVQRFYGTHARLYDWIAHYTPGVGRWRTATVDALALEPGATVVDIGCGTGATLPYLRDAVGPTGTVVGLDFTPEVLNRARTRTEPWANVHILSGDATQLPLVGSIDGVVGCFIVGLFDDPVSVIQSWEAVLAEDGRIAFLDAAPRDRSNPLDWGFELVVRAGAPPGSRKGAGNRLATRVDRAHEYLATHASNLEQRRRARGFVRITAGTV